MKHSKRSSNGCEEESTSCSEASGSEPDPELCVTDETKPLLQSDEAKEGRKEKDYETQKWVAVVICGVCLCMFLGTTVFYLWDGEVAFIGVIYGIVLFALRNVISSVIYVLSTLMYRAAGFSKADIDAMRQPGHKWPPRMLEGLIDKYGERRVKVCDAINRRSSHVFGCMFNWGIFIPFVVPSHKARVAAVLTYTTVKLGFKCSFLWSDNLIAKILFRSTRLRDGVMGRFNLMVVYFVAIGFLPLVTLLILRSDIREIHSAAIMGYVFQPCIWGDAMAEIIGSFFGRYEFSVQGMGEINKKTIEGVLACLTCSACACYVYSLAPTFPSQAYFSIPLIALHTMVAAVATLMETICFRGTDNGFMILSSALVVLYFYDPNMTEVPEPIIHGNATDVMGLGLWQMTGLL
jgi:dolichol kinase